jgi:hypothetical protein
LNQVKRSRKSGKKTYVPLAYAEWEILLNQLHPKVEERINKLKRNALKQAEQEFYYPMLQDIRAVRDAWRNHVMHTRAEYSWKESDAVFEHVRRIMTGLATRIADNVTPVARPRIRLAQYGIGGSNYLDVTELLRGYVASDVEVLASNHFFSDPYPKTDKHLIVKYCAPGGRAVKTITVREGQPVRFTK